MSKGILALIIILIIVVVVIAVFVGIYNTMIQKQADVQNGWSQVENQYQRRADLIPNLVETVQGITKQELAVFTEVADSRSQWAAAQTRDQQITAANQMDGALGRLIAVAEAYPEIKSNENFLGLQSQLEGTENRIAVERGRYNDKVTDFNKYLRVWPNSMFATMFGFAEEDLFKAEAGTDQPPEVKF